MQAALEDRLPKPLRYIRVLACFTFNSLTSGLIQAVRKKNSWIASGFAQEYLCSGSGYEPG